jgi:hypothetical protein
MKDHTEFTLMGVLGLSCFRPPTGYSWDDVTELGTGYDHYPVNAIHPMIVFRCIMAGLASAKVHEI